MILLWLVVGIIVVSSAFFIPGSPTEVWTNLNYAGIAVVAYLIALLLYSMRKPFRARTQIIVGVASLVVIGALGMSWTGMDDTSHWQKATLLKIREIIGRGVMCAEVPDTLLNVLDDFHHPSRGRKLSLGQVFRTKHPKISVGDNIHQLFGPNDSLRAFVTSLSDTQITITAQELFVKGRDPDFKNYNRRIGMVQEKFVLTAKGLRHESEN